MVFNSQSIKWDQTDSPEIPDRGETYMAYIHIHARFVDLDLDFENVMLLAIFYYCFVIVAEPCKKRGGKTPGRKQNKRNQGGKTDQTRKRNGKKKAYLRLLDCLLNWPLLGAQPTGCAIIVYIIMFLSCLLH